MPVRLESLLASAELMLFWPSGIVELQIPLRSSAGFKCAHVCSMLVGHMSELKRDGGIVIFN